ncbi:hypothetical protein ARMGADRAFT_1077374 [Armillaria gallica]|uniref:Secreted protein n=1 Tax=Armillaria gallica TaxID=47427 RepID=A0A2H3E3E2_ARMGA|nr:hypothetical protein ARMGADRAFT_1077374 [Armillaria gallica]
MSVVLIVSFPVFVAWTTISVGAETFLTESSVHTPVKLRLVCISTASPSTSSVSSLLHIPMLRHKAPVFDIESENTSLELAAITVEITSGPSVCTIPTSHIQGKASKEGNRDAPNAIAIFPVDGGPANDIARPAIRPSCNTSIIPPGLGLPNHSVKIRP